MSHWTDGLTPTREAARLAGEFASKAPTDRPVHVAVAVNNADRHVMATLNANPAYQQYRKELAFLGDVRTALTNRYDTDATRAAIRNVEARRRSTEALMAQLAAAALSDYYSDVASGWDPTGEVVEP